MSLSSDLMGLGVSPLLAARTATAGTGPITIVPTQAAAFGSATRIQVTQFLVGNTTVTGGAISLPPVGGDNGALIGDDFTINNATTGSLTVFCSSGVTISVSGANTASTVMTSHTTMTCYPISTTQWIGVKGT
jgi:hypothetical protein